MSTIRKSAYVAICLALVVGLVLGSGCTAKKSEATYKIGQV